MTGTGNFNELYDISIVISVTDYHWEHAARNVILTTRQNPEKRIKWVLVANNHDPDFPIPESVLSNPEVLLLEGFPFERFKGEHRPGSNSLSAGIRLGMDHVDTRFAAQLDADYFIIYPNWIREVLDHMQARKLGVWGTPWHLKRLHKWRGFPCSHLTLFDQQYLPLSKLDFNPEYGRYFEFQEIPVPCRTWLHLWYLEERERRQKNALVQKQAQRIKVSRAAEQVPEPILPNHGVSVRAQKRFNAYGSRFVNFVDHRKWTEGIRDVMSDGKRLASLNFYARNYAIALRVRDRRLRRGVFDPGSRARTVKQRLDFGIGNQEREISELKLAVSDMRARLESGEWKDRLTKPLYEILQKKPGRLARHLFGLYDNLSKRIEIGTTADCNVKIRRYCRDTGIHFETCQVSLKREDFGYNHNWSIWKKLVFNIGLGLEQLLPDRLNLRPFVHRSVTWRTFSDLRLPDFGAAGWEEYFWNRRPFAVHIRTTSRSARELEMYIQERWLTQFLSQANGAEITANCSIGAVNQPELKAQRQVSQRDGGNVLEKYYSTARLRNLKDIHKGKRAFIIANGPSLSTQDLEQIKDEISFGCNKIYLKYPETEWRPTYYFCEDRNVLQQTHRQINEFVKGSSRVFVPLNLPNSNVPPITERIDGAVYYRALWPDWRTISNPGLLFSTELDEGVVIGGTVVYTMIQFARYMGFEQIYILGCDHRFAAMSESPLHSLSLRVGNGLHTGEIVRFLDRNGYLNVSKISERFVRYPGDYVYTKSKNGNVEIHSFIISSRLGGAVVRVEIAGHVITALERLEGPDVFRGRFIPIYEYRCPGIYVVSRGARNHFDKNYRVEGEKWGSPNIRLLEKVYRTADSHVSAHKGQIVNLTRDTELEVFRTATLESVLSHCA